MFIAFFVSFTDEEETMIAQEIQYYKLLNFLT